MNRISSDTINDVHKFNDPKLLQNPTIYQPGKYIACYYDKICYIVVILESSNEYQDVKGLNLQWVNDTRSSHCWVSKFYFAMYKEKIN